MAGPGRRPRPDRAGTNPFGPVDRSHINAERYWLVIDPGPAICPAVLRALVLFHPDIRTLTGLRADRNSEVTTGRQGVTSAFGAFRSSGCPAPDPQERSW